MTQQEYTEKIAELEAKKRAAIALIDKEIASVQRDYAFSNNPYKVGDIIENYQVIIKIERIKYSTASDIPECVYLGTPLTKGLKPKKTGCKEGRIYQSRIIKHHEIQKG